MIACTLELWNKINSSFCKLLLLGVFITTKGKVTETYFDPINFLMIPLNFSLTCLISCPQFCLLAMHVGSCNIDINYQWLLIFKQNFSLPSIFLNSPASFLIIFIVTIFVLCPKLCTFWGSRVFLTSGPVVSQFHFCIMDPTSQRNAHHCVYSEIHCVYNSNTTLLVIPSQASASPLNISVFVWFLLAVLKQMQAGGGKFISSYNSHLTISYWEKSRKELWEKSGKNLKVEAGLWMTAAYWLTLSGLLSLPTFPWIGPPTGPPCGHWWQSGINHTECNCSSDCLSCQNTNIHGNHLSLLHNFYVPELRTTPSTINSFLFK